MREYDCVNVCERQQECVGVSVRPERVRGRRRSEHEKAGELMTVSTMKRSKSSVRYSREAWAWLCRRLQGYSFWVGSPQQEGESYGAVSTERHRRRVATNSKGVSATWDCPFVTGRVRRSAAIPVAKALVLGCEEAEDDTSSGKAAAWSVRSCSSSRVWWERATKR